MRVEVLTEPGDGRHVRLRFTSDGHRSQWLARRRAFLDGRRPDGDYFEFSPPARYRGIKMKRGPYRPDEMLELRPGETVESETIDLAQHYRLAEGAVFSVRYVGSHPLEGTSAAGGPYTRVESAWVQLLPRGAALAGG